MPPRSHHLSPPLRFFFLFLNLILGILPSFAFFAWVERNASLPWVGLELGWPWIDLQAWPVAALAAWNCSLFLGFGAIHTIFAQSRVQSTLRRLIPIQGIRSVYLAITGISLILLMGLWQNTGVVLWSLPGDPRFLLTLSLVLYWGIWLCAGTIMARFDVLEFLGFKQIYSSTEELSRPEGIARLDTRGAFAYVRHPIYALNFLAVAMAPLMTLDRALLIASMALYLIVAIPIEERKLIALFGTAYKTYRTRVPALIPLRFGLTKVK